MKNSNTEKVVLALLREVSFVTDEDAVALDSHFEADLGLDSLDIIELYMSVEAKFDIDSDILEKGERAWTGRELVAKLKDVPLRSAGADFEPGLDFDSLPELEQWDWIAKARAYAPDAGPKQVLRLAIQSYEESASNATA